MKKIIFAAVLALGVSGSVLADTKIAVIDMQNLFQNLPQIKQINADLEKQAKDGEKQLTTAQQSFKNDADKFKKDEVTMSEKDKQAAQDKLFQEQQALQKTQMEIQKNLMTIQNDKMTGVMNDVKKVVAKIAAEDKFDLVLASAAVPYSNKDMDITPKVLKAMGGQ